MELRWRVSPVPSTGAARNMPTIEYRFLYHGPSSGQICSDLTFRDEKRLEAGEGLWHREEEQLIYTEVTAVRRG